jgi:hypothetical protein
MFSRWNYRVLLSIVSLAAVPIAFAAGPDPDARLTAPSVESQVEAQKLVKQLYGSEYQSARTVEQKHALAEKLLRKGLEINDDPTGQYVMLKAARDIAVLAGDGELAIRAVGVMGEKYQIDVLAMQVETLLKAIKTATASYGPATADSAWTVINQASMKNEYDKAIRLAEAAGEMAERIGDRGLETRLGLRLEELRQAATAYQRHKESAAALAASPNDPQASRAAGKYPGLATGENPYAGRTGDAKQSLLQSGGGTAESERAVAAALAWLARHQNNDGSWSLDYHARCRGPGCTGPGGADAPGAATALALLPFLAAGQTHETRGPYKSNIYAGITWMISHQKPTGDLSVTGGQTQMYSHGISTIMLCEAYGMSHDKRLEAPAKAAVHFIESGQDQQTGGWRYTHKVADADTSVFGWQLMALQSAKWAGLAVSSQTTQQAQHWLDAVGKGTSKGLFSYVVQTGPTETMTAVGLLCTQYLGAQRNDPRIVEGTRFLMANLPSAASGRAYYWYYATQVMHNQPGPDWEKWNRQQQALLVKSQCGDPGCANGSWDPQQGMPEWAGPGGRLMATSLSSLTLEVCYRYPPPAPARAPGRDPGGLRLQRLAGAAASRIRLPRGDASLGDNHLAHGEEQRSLSGGRSTPEEIGGPSGVVGEDPAGAQEKRFIRLKCAQTQAVTP